MGVLHRQLPERHASSVIRCASWVRISVAAAGKSRGDTALLTLDRSRYFG